jgi:hypothetical protein
MKNIFLILCFVLIFACKITDNGNGQGTAVGSAELVLTNKINHIVTVQIIDGSSTLISVSLNPNGQFRKTWQEYEPIFSNLSGVLLVRYSSDLFPEKELNVILHIGQTIYRDIRLDESSLTIYNNTLFDIQFYLQDGSNGSSLAKTVQSKKSYVQMWNEFSPLYTTQAGMATLSYYNQQGQEIYKLFHIPLGDHIYHQIDDVDYVLKIRNNTKSETWYSLDGTAFPPMDSYGFDMFYRQDFTNFSPKNISYSGYHCFSANDVIFISEFFSTDFSIEPDAGAISLRNQANVRINSVYITGTTNPTWGYDVLNDYLYFNEEAIWTVEFGSWDMRIVDENNIEYFAYHFYVAFDTTEQFLFPQHFIETKNLKSDDSAVFSKVELKKILK